MVGFENTGGLVADLAFQHPPQSPAAERHATMALTVALFAAALSVVSLVGARRA